MTEREKAFEKARKIYALVQEGVDGEKESARVAFERICRAHGFGEDDFLAAKIGQGNIGYFVISESVQVDFNSHGVILQK